MQQGSFEHFFLLCPIAKILQCIMSKLGLIGMLHSFDADQYDFNLYVEQLEHFFNANDAEEVKKVSVFISAIGNKTKCYEICCFQPCHAHACMRNLRIFSKIILNLLLLLLLNVFIKETKPLENLFLNI